MRSKTLMKFLPITNGQRKQGHEKKHSDATVCVCVCVCARARARVCVRALPIYTGDSPSDQGEKCASLCRGFRGLHFAAFFFCPF